MSVIVTGNKVHDAALSAAEMTRATAYAGAVTPAQFKAADIAYHRACKASCLANNNGSGIEQFTMALRELGTGGS